MKARLWLAVGATWALSTVGAGVVFAPAHADTSSSTGVGDSAEAWYDTSASTLCTSAIGCPPATLTSPSYPANTLHVGVNFGSASSSTYLMPDLSAYVGGTLPTAGAMTLPLATVSGNGNSSPSTATIKACLSKGLFKDGTAGSQSTPPATDCTVTEKLTYANNAFSLDLTPFLAAWSNGTPQDGIALQPDLTGTNPTTSWQVAFNGRNLANAAHITSTVTGGSGAGTTTVTDSAPVTTVAATSQPVATPLPDGGPATPVVDQPTPPDASTSPAIAPTPVAATTASTSPGTALAQSGASGNTTPAAGGSTSFQYPEVLLLPLLIAGAMLFVLRLLTSDATPKRLRARPIKKEA